MMRSSPREACITSACPLEALPAWRSTADSVGKSHGFCPAAGQSLGDLHVAEGKRDFNGMRRLQPPALDWSFPPEVIQMHRPLPQRRSALGDLHDRSAIRVVADDQEEK